MFAFIRRPDLIRDDDVPQGDFFAASGANAAHREAGRRQFIEQLFATNGCGLLAHFANPCGGDGEGFAGIGEKLARMQAKAFGIPRLLPAIGQSENSFELVLNGSQDQDVDALGHARRIGQMDEMVNDFSRDGLGTRQVF